MNTCTPIENAHDVCVEYPNKGKTTGAHRLQTITIRGKYNVDTQRQRPRALDLLETVVTTETCCLSLFVSLYTFSQPQ